MKTYVVSIHLKRLDEALQMNTNSICRGEIRKNQYFYVKKNNNKISTALYYQELCKLKDYYGKGIA